LVGLSALFLLFVYPGYLQRDPVPPETLPREPDLADTQQEQEVTLYFSNQEYIQSGQSDLPMIIAVQRMVKFSDETLLVKVLAELRKPPEDERYSTALHEGLEIISAWRVNNRVYVDFASENLWGGSLQETLLVHQIVKTLTDLPGIDEVQFLVEGENQGSLMGHIATDEPLSPDHL
jgi:spore germination protein GerM